MPTTAKQQVRERIFSAYASTTRANTPEHRFTPAVMSQFRRRFGRFLPADRSLATLDIACGGGEFLVFLRSRGYVSAAGIDISPEQVAIARSRGLTNVQEGDALEYLDGRDAQYALITAFNILEHFERDEMLALMDRIVKALQPGGRFIAMVPNAKGLFGSQVRYADLTHELSFTPLSVLQLCNVVGLRPLTIFENGPMPHGVSSALRWVVWQGIRGLLLVARLAEGADWTWPVFTQDLFFVAERPPNDAGAPR